MKTLNITAFLLLIGFIFTQKLHSQNTLLDTLFKNNFISLEFGGNYYSKNQTTKDDFYTNQNNLRNLQNNSNDNSFFIGVKNEINMNKKNSISFGFINEIKALNDNVIFDYNIYGNTQNYHMKHTRYEHSIIVPIQYKKRFFIDKLKHKNLFLSSQLNLEFKSNIVNFTGVANEVYVDSFARVTSYINQIEDFPYSLNGSLSFSINKILKNKNILSLNVGYSKAIIPYLINHTEYYYQREDLITSSSIKVSLDYHKRGSNFFYWGISYTFTKYGN